MTELGKNSLDSKINRRTALKKIAKGSLGFAALAVFGNELQKTQEGVKTNVGTFIPLYERHDQGISPESLPANLDGYFKELAGNEMFSLTPKDLLRAQTGVYRDLKASPEGIPIPRKILSKLAKEGTEIIFGDIKVSQEEDVKIWTIENAFFIPSLMSVLSDTVLPDTITKRIDSKVGIARRKFLRNSLLALGLWNISKQRASYYQLKEAFPEENAITRILARIEGLGSNLHPELPMIFFRNLLMADKMLTVAEQMRKEKNRKPRIAFQVEGAHSGIEDFLQVGQSVVRSLILAYPKDWRKEVYRINGGLDNFCSARLLKLPKDFQERDFYDDSKMELIVERSLIDKDLRERILQS